MTYKGWNGGGKVQEMKMVVRHGGGIERGELWVGMGACEGVKDWVVMYWV